MKRTSSTDATGDKNTASYGDKYYTAKTCMESIVADAVPHFLAAQPSKLLFIDFSAGDGALAGVLSARMPNVEYIGIDIAPPAQSTVVRGDWTALETAGPDDEVQFQAAEQIRAALARSPGALIVAGFNPPFGRAGTMAKRFVNIALAWIKPDMMLLILPVRTWHIPGHDVAFQRFLPANSFYLPGTGAAFAASTEAVLLRRQPGVAGAAVTEHKLLAGGAELTLTAHDTGRLSLALLGPAVLLIRKVGEYAGRHVYLLDPVRQRILYFCPQSPGTVHDFNAALFDATAGPALIRAGHTPWSQRGHTVCDIDPPPAYRGSKASGTGQPSRQGTGFLKCTVANWTDLNLDNDAFFRVCSRFGEFIVSNGLNTGQPRSISAAIAERAWHAAVTAERT